MTRPRKIRKKNATADARRAAQGLEPPPAAETVMTLTGPFSRTTLRARLALLTLGGQPTRLSRP